MAKLTIEIEENEFALWDYAVYYNGILWSEGSNYTTEQGAHLEAVLRGQEAWAVR
jgi:hypothetical protein